MQASGHHCEARIGVIGLSWSSEALFVPRRAFETVSDVCLHEGFRSYVRLNVDCFTDEL